MSAWEAAGWAVTMLVGLMALCLAAIPVTSAVGWWHDRRHGRTAGQAPTLDQRDGVDGPLDPQQVARWCRQIHGADSIAIWTELGVK